MKKTQVFTKYFKYLELVVFFIKDELELAASVINCY